jgi:hypothetical protein
LIARKMKFERDEKIIECKKEEEREIKRERERKQEGRRKMYKRERFLHSLLGIIIVQIWLSRIIDSVFLIKKKVLSEQKRLQILFWQCSEY